MRPFREGLLLLDPPRLLGSHCSACAVSVFPPREFCPRCRAVQGVTRVELSTRGHVHSFTVVRQAPPGVAVPYVLAWVDLPVDDVRVLAQVDGAPGDVTVGTAVELDLAEVGTDGDGAALAGSSLSAAGIIAIICIIASFSGGSCAGHSTPSFWAMGARFVWALV